MTRIAEIHPNIIKHLIKPQQQINKDVFQINIKKQVYIRDLLEDKYLQNLDGIPRHKIFPSILQMK